MPFDHSKYAAAVSALRRRWKTGEFQSADKDAMKIFTIESNILTRPRPLRDIPLLVRDGGAANHFEDFLYERCVALKNTLSDHLRDHSISEKSRNACETWQTAGNDSFCMRILKKFHDCLLERYIDFHVDQGYTCSEQMLLSIYGFKGMC